MKIVLFSDIHANLPALESFFKSVEEQKPDSIYCLGDLVGYNIWPNEVINELRKRHIPTIAGNYDDGVGRNSDDCGCAYKTEEQIENGKQSIAFTNGIIKEEERTYLRSLTAHIRIDFQFNKEKLSVLLVHGSPRKINEYIFEDREEKSTLRMLEQAGADILCFGHTHQPYHRVLNSGKEGENYFRHLINLGSVGKPKDGDPRGSYVLLEIDDKSSVSNAHSIKVEFIRFTYDVEKAAKAVENSPLPNVFADALRFAK
jgi:putative phosphoesterase